LTISVLCRVSSARVSCGAIPLAAGRPSSEFLAQEFLERHVKPNQRHLAYVLEHDVLPEWKGRDARTITPHEVVELLDKIVARGSRVMQTERLVCSDSCSSLGFAGPSSMTVRSLSKRKLPAALECEKPASRGFRTC
jgi:hypothetical protein